MISSAARDRIKLAIDQLEEAFHRYDEQSSADINDSHSAHRSRARERRPNSLSYGNPKSLPVKGGAAPPGRRSTDPSRWSRSSTSPALGTSSICSRPTASPTPM